MQGPKLLVAAAYLLIGIATLAMCFDLMQEEIIAKFTWLGKRLGIMDKEEETDVTEKENTDQEFVNDETNQKKLIEVQGNVDENEKKHFISSKSSFVDENFFASYNGIPPAFNYQSNALGDKQYLQFRTAFSQNVVQNQQIQ